MENKDAGNGTLSGCLIMVVGPSGVGKDTLMQAAKTLLQDEPTISFPHRLITRESNIEYEDHGSITMAEFENLCASGAAPVFWQAHGHGYIIPQRVLEAVRAGGCCVMNGSRGALDQAQAAFPRAYAVLIDLDRRNLETRIAERGREQGEEAKRRLERTQPDLSGVRGVQRLVNNGTIEEGAQRLATLIKDCAEGRLPAL
ncbi:MAG: phosphonate metabolism protein/1,5-bisphosphokinase (PRPP-forming) PhnN [Pseudomonadota bacterium]